MATKKNYSPFDSPLPTEPPEDSPMDRIEDARSNMPYGFGGGGWNDPRAGAGSGKLSGPGGGAVITNGVIWAETGDVFDMDTVRATISGQEDC